MARIENYELKLAVPMNHFQAFVLNKYVLSGIGGFTREDAFDSMIASWYESHHRTLERRGISISKAEELNYIPFIPWSDEEIEALREERQSIQDLSSKSFDLNLVLSGIPAYLFETVPTSGLIETVSSAEGLTRKMIFDYFFKERRLMRRLRITREEAIKEGYLPTRKKN